MKKRSIKAIAIIAAFCVAFTSLPMMMGELESSAMAKKKAKVAKNVTVSASASGQTRAVIKWNKIKSPNNGYAVFRNGAVIAHMGKKYAFTDTGLKAGTAYTYQIRTYKTKKVKQWYNKATGKWQKKKPKKKWRGKSRKVTTYTYKKKSNVVTVRTAPLNKYTITWKNWDGTILQSSTVLQGSKPSYSGSTPTRAADDYIYTFKGWSPAVTAATGNKVYTAQYTAKENILPAPKGISYAVKSASGYIKITWNAVSGAEAYAISYDGKVKQQSSTTFFLTPFTEGENYTFQVAAIRNGKLQTKSKEFTITANSGASGTVEDTATPATPATPTTPTTPTTETKQVTDYLGTTRTITKSAGESYWYTSDGAQCNPMARYDKTVDGEFTVSGTTWKQIDGATFNLSELNKAAFTADGKTCAFTAYNLDSAKLKMELGSGISIQATTDKTWTSGTSYADEKSYYFVKNGNRIARTHASGNPVGITKSGNTSTVCYYIYRHKENSGVGDGLGFYNADITVNVSYGGKAVGTIKASSCPVSTVDGMHPARRLALDIAQAGIDSRGGSTGSLDQDLQNIAAYIEETYYEKEVVSGYGWSEKMICNHSTYILETWAVYAYGDAGRGFAGWGASSSSTHVAFHLNSNPGRYYEVYYKE